MQPHVSLFHVFNEVTLLPMSSRVWWVELGFMQCRHGMMQTPFPMVSFAHLEQKLWRRWRERKQQLPGGYFMICTFDEVNSNRPLKSELQNLSLFRNEINVWEIIALARFVIKEGKGQIESTTVCIKFCEIQTTYTLSMHVLTETHA